MENNSIPPYYPYPAENDDLKEVNEIIKGKLYLTGY